MMKTVIINLAISLALGWSAVFVCILLNAVRGYSNPDFIGGKEKYRLPARAGKPWPWWIHLILSPVYGAVIAAFAWMWLVLVLPFVIIRQSQRRKSLARR